MPWRHKPEQQLPAAPQSVSISSITGSAVAVGSNNYTVQGSSVEAGAAAAQLDDALATVRRMVEVQAGNLAQPALTQVAALDLAVRADPPDSTVIDTVCGWFTRNLPSIVPAVLEVAGHPSIDTALKAAAQVAQAQVRDATGPAPGGV